MRETATKITPEIMAEIEEINEKNNRLYEIGVISAKENAVHLTRDVFEMSFPEYTVTDFKADPYNFEKYAYINGIKYFAIYKEV